MVDWYSSCNEALMAEIKRDDVVWYEVDKMLGQEFTAIMFEWLFLYSCGIMLS